VNGLYLFDLPPSLERLSSGMTSVAQQLLIFLFLVALFIAAIRRFENFSFESTIIQTVGLGILILLWPSFVDSIGGLVAVFNAAVWSAFSFGEANNLKDVISVIEPWVDENHGKGFFGRGLSSTGPFLLPLAMALPIGLNVAVALLEYLFSLFLVFYKFFGPLILARGVLGANFQVGLDLTREVVILHLWQTTLIIIVGAMALSLRGAL
jgi:hypothetical protein